MDVVLKSVRPPPPPLADIVVPFIRMDDALITLKLASLAERSP